MNFRNRVPIVARSFDPCVLDRGSAQSIIGTIVGTVKDSSSATSAEPRELIRGNASK